MEKEVKEIKVKEKASRRRKAKSSIARGKRKEAIARAVIKEGKKNVIRLNGLMLDAISSPVVKQIIAEPLIFSDDIGKTLQIDVNVSGGGVMGQAQAARTAIAKAIVEFTGSEELKQKMLEYDRSLLIEDPRRVEPKKFKGPKARARFTKSYR